MSNQIVPFLGDIEPIATWYVIRPSIKTGRLNKMARGKKQQRLDREWEDDLTKLPRHERQKRWTNEKQHWDSFYSFLT